MNAKNEQTKIANDHEAKMTEITKNAELKNKNEDNRHSEELKRLSIQEQEMKANVDLKIKEIIDNIQNTNIINNNNITKDTDEKIKKLKLNSDNKIEDNEEEEEEDEEEIVLAIIITKKKEDNNQKI